MSDQQGWTDPLRPDDVASARLRQSVRDAARPLLARRRDNWFDVASRWATLLTPVAAVLTLVFAGLAISHSIPTDTRELGASGEVAGLLGSDIVPADFSSEFDDTADIVFAALDVGLPASQAPVTGPDSAADNPPPER